MKKIFSYISIFFIAISLFMPFVAGAVPVTPKTESSTSGVYKLLAPIGNLVSINTNSIGDYFNVIFKIAIGLCGALAVVMIIISSIQYMGDESVFGKTEAKSKIFSSVLGLLIALGSYALLNTINPDLLGSKGLTIEQVTINISPDVPQATPRPGDVYPGTSYKYGAAWPSEDKKNKPDDYERGILEKLGISVKKPPCIEVGQTDCTSVYNLDTKYVELLKKIAGKDSEIEITGGTEFWLHGANTLRVHYPGGWVIDLEKTPTLTTYVHGLTKKHLDKWADGGADCYYDSTYGIGMVEEASHFHAMNGKCDINNQGSM
jgi:hypothetical protein